MEPCSRAWTAWALVALASGPLGSQQEPVPTPEGEAPVLIQCGSQAELYLLTAPAQGEGRPERLGYLVYERAPMGGGGEAREMAFRFHDGGLHIRLVETCEPDLRQLVYREYGAQALRTWVAREQPGCGELAIERYGAGRGSAVLTAPPAPVLFPLECIERLRAGCLEGRIERMSLTSGVIESTRVEPIELDLMRLPQAWSCLLLEGRTLAPRAYRLVHSDGEPGEAYLFDGDELVGIELQAGGICAMRLETAAAAGVLAEFDQELAREDRWQDLRAWADMRASSR